MEEIEQDLANLRSGLDIADTIKVKVSNKKENKGTRDTLQKTNNQAGVSVDLDIGSGEAGQSSDVKATRGQDEVGVERSSKVNEGSRKNKDTESNRRKDQTEDVAMVTGFVLIEFFGDFFMI